MLPCWSNFLSIAVTLDYYGLSERVCLATSYEPEQYYFHPLYGHVELFRAASDVSPGGSSAEIDATGFWNRAMPLVRLRTGDSILIPHHYSDVDLEEWRWV